MPDTLTAPPMYISKSGVPFSVPQDDPATAARKANPPAKTGNRLVDTVLADDELSEDEVGVLTEAAKGGDPEAGDLLDNLGIDWKLVGAVGGVAATGAMLGSAAFLAKQDWEGMSEAPLLTGRRPGYKPTTPPSVDQVNVQSSIDAALDPKAGIPSEMPIDDVTRGFELPPSMETAQVAPPTNTAPKVSVDAANPNLTTASSLLRLRTKGAKTPADLQRAVVQAERGGIRTPKATQKRIANAVVRAAESNELTKVMQELEQLQSDYAKLQAASKGKITPAMEAAIARMRALALKMRHASGS